jgi:hypothetical protein
VGEPGAASSGVVYEFRYAIGNRTPGLHVDAGGALTIEIQAARPASTANWLPVPAGRFRLMLRLYRPADPRWVPPPVVAVGTSTVS